MLAFSDLLRAFFLALAGGLLIVLALVVRRYSKFRQIAGDARNDSTVRHWKLVNAYGPQQAEPPDALTFNEALAFLKEHVGCPFVRVDSERGIIFFDGRKLGG